MTDPKFTPGPWEVKYKNGETQLLMSDGDIHMCNMHYYPWVPENDADWHLIAAAPDLYEALEAVLSSIPDMGNYYDGAEDAFEQARTALAKARGDHSSSD
jgi:hypothetical protein